MRLCLFLCLALLSCSDTDKFEVAELLDARDQSISAQDITAYSQLLLESYRTDGGGDVLQQMQSIFLRFDEVNMRSRDREIRILSDTEAMCEQTYVLKVLADGDWREIVQREQLSFSRVNDVWKISGGL
ncbi:MAG: hypothetical protein Q9M19_07340 [Mariprofundaceae bacterium]|nr:hypothetical protein [Mariprofundaceae bacterium]